jgi:hypothetical protein
MAAGTGPTRMQDTEAWRDLAQHDQEAARAAVRQELLVESTAEAIGEFEDVAKAYDLAGFPELAGDARIRADIAREDNDAALAGVDYRDLDNHFHGQSQATPERAAQFWPCGYPETHAGQLAAAERETDLEAGS